MQRACRVEWAAASVGDIVNAEEGVLWTGSTAEALFNSNAYSFGQWRRKTCSRAEPYAPTLDTISERAQQLLRLSASLMKLPMPVSQLLSVLLAPERLMTPVSEEYTASVRITCYLCFFELSLISSHSLFLRHIHMATFGSRFNNASETKRIGVVCSCNLKFG